MKTILDEQFAPITSMVGFLEVPLDVAVEACRAWRSGLYPGVSVTEVPEAFPEVLHSLEPLLHAVRSRNLLVEMGGWTVYFDNGRDGTDPVGPIMHLSRTLGCSGLIIACSPQTMGIPGVEQRFGSVQFQLLGPTGKPPLYYVRTVGVSYDPHVVFDIGGTPLPFEETEAYTARRRRDRFTSEMLERYCRALGVTPFDPQSYGRATLIEWPPVSWAGEPTVWTWPNPSSVWASSPGRPGAFRAEFNERLRTDGPGRPSHSKVLDPRRTARALEPALGRSTLA